MKKREMFQLFLTKMDLQIVGELNETYGRYILTCEINVLINIMMNM